MRNCKSVNGRAGDCSFNSGSGRACAKDCESASLRGSPSTSNSTNSEASSRLDINWRCIFGAFWLFFPDDMVKQQNVSVRRKKILTIMLTEDTYYQKLHS